jgi:hypothetical protein
LGPVVQLSVTSMKFISLGAVALLASPTSMDSRGRTPPTTSALVGEHVTVGESPQVVPSREITGR